LDGWVDARTRRKRYVLAVEYTGQQEGPFGERRDKVAL
jgi:hypothetical protein